jgi:hypothetical protein
MSHPDSGFDGRIYGRTPKGRIVEIRNWQLRSDSGTLVAVPLPDDQARLVLALKEAGFNDTRIFHLLHGDDHPPSPPTPPPAAEFPRAEIRFDLENLGKEWLIGIVEKLLGHPVPSMVQMDRRDIAVLIRSLVEKGLLRIAVG